MAEIPCAHPIVFDRGELFDSYGVLKKRAELGGTFHPDDVDVVEEFSEARAKFIALQTEKPFSEIQARNIEANYRARRKSIEVLYGTMPGGRCLIVGAGPSLKRKIGEVRAVREDGETYILAVDRAYKTLESEGIVPDATITVDPQKKVLFFLKGCKSDLFMSIGSPPLLAEIVNGRVFQWGPCFPRSPFWKAVYKYCGRGVANAFASITVIYSAVSVAVFLGHTRIRTVGNDLQWDNWRQFTEDPNFEAYKKDTGPEPEKKDWPVSITPFIYVSKTLSAFPTMFPEIDFSDASGGLEKPLWIKSEKVAF